MSDACYKLEHVLLDTVVKDLLLGGAHGKDLVEGEAVALWAGAHCLGAHLDGREVIVEGGDDFWSFAQLGGI